MMDSGPGIPETTDDADAALDAAIESAVAEAPEEEIQEAAAEPAASERPRDELGRFTAEPPTAEPDPAPADVAPALETPGEPTAPDAEPAPDELPDEPFVYRADNQDHEIPGSAVGEDGIFIPAAVVPDVQRLLSSGKAAEGSVRQRLTDAAAREQQALDRAAAAEAQRDHILGHFEGLIQKGPETIGQWLQNMHQAWPILQAEAAAKAAELKNQQALKELARYQAQEQEVRLRPLMDQTLQQSVRQYAAAAGLDEGTMQAVYRQLSQPHNRDLVFVRAPFDDPAQGIKQGDLVIANHVIAGAVELASINRPSAVQQQKIAQAQAENKKLAAAPAKVPPTVAGKGKAPAAPAVPAFQTTKDVDRWFEEGGFMDLDTEE